MSDKLYELPPLEAPSETTAARPLFELIADRMRQSGAVPGGFVPSETALAARFHVGRQQVREALSTLEGLGAVESRQGAPRVWWGVDPSRFWPKASLLVPDPAATIRQLLQVRHALETTLLPQAAMTLTPDTITTLRELSEEIVETCAQGQRFPEADEAFHRTLFAGLDNALLDGILTSFWALFRVTGQGDSAIHEDPAIAAMHGQIVEAIQVGDIRRAMHYMDAHFYGIRSRVPADEDWEMNSPGLTQSA